MEHRPEKGVKHRKYRIVVQEANRRQGLRRFAYMSEAEAWLAKQGYSRAALADAPEDVRQDFITVWWERSACLAATSVFEVDGQAVALPSCDEFLDLPDALIGPWSRAVAELNPHWSSFGQEEDEAAEKKDEPPPSG